MLQKGGFRVFEGLRALGFRLFRISGMALKMPSGVSFLGLYKV